MVADYEEGVARQLRQTYEKWRIQRMPRDEERKELRNYLFATDTSTTTNSALPWKNRTTIPKLTQIRDNLHANYFDAIFPNEDWLRWEGNSQDDVTKQKKTVIEAYIKNKCKQSGFMETMSRCLLDYIDNGEAIAEVVWVNESHWDDVLQEEVNTYTGPKVFRVSPWDHYYNPSAVSYTKSPKFTRYLKNIGELVKELEVRTDLHFDTEAFDKLLKYRRSFSAYSYEDINKADGYYADGFGSLSEYLGSGLVEILEYEGDLYSETDGTFYQNRIITIADGCIVLRNIPNPNWLGKDNKVKVCWRERPDNLYGMGPLDNLVGMQYRLDHLENLKADALDLTIHPPIKIKGDVEPFVWGPGTEIHLPEDGDVESMAPNSAAFSVNNEIAYLMNLMEEMAGAPKQAMGFRTPGEKTAFEVQQLENAASRIFNNKIMKFSIEFMEPLLNLMLESAKRNMKVSDVIKVMDDDFGVAEFVNITRDDITAKGKLYPMGSRHFSARAQMIQNLTGIANSPLLGLIQPHLSSTQLASFVEDVMGLSKYALFRKNIAVAEQAETQRLIMTERQAITKEGTVDVEGGIENLEEE